MARPEGLWRQLTATLTLTLALTLAVTLALTLTLTLSNANQGRDRLLHGECALITVPPEELGGGPGVGEADAQLHEQ